MSDIQNTIKVTKKINYSVKTLLPDIAAHIATCKALRKTFVFAGYVPFSNSHILSVKFHVSDVRTILNSVGQTVF